MIQFTVKGQSEQEHLFIARDLIFVSFTVGMSAMLWWRKREKRRKVVLVFCRQLLRNFFMF